MTLFGSPRDRKKDDDRSYAQIGLLAAVPGILIAAPLIGYFAGNWADQKFGTEPTLMIIGIVLGLVSAGMEIYRLVKKAEKIGDEGRSNRHDL
uniref:AtpZ/AtpI family protein n=1 Tax=uncultured bacterium pAW1 TaxID=1781155 RepID=A0A1C9U4R5_9BACT|nr:hypothetical protein [uncultured bacterium pAW1]